MKDLISKTAKYRAEARRRKLWQRVVSLLACVVVFITTYAQILPAITLEADLFEPDGHVHTDECYKIVKTEEKTELDCPLELHTHTAACYDADGALACGYADFVVHTHDSYCYDQNGKLVCTLPEIEEHTHTALCYPVQVDGPAAGTGSTGAAHVHTDECYTEMPGALVCGEEETDGHTHTEDCYVETEQLVCELEESEGHTHTDLCMDAEGLPELCGLEESEGHTHDESCYETVRELVCEQEEAEPHTHTEDCYAPAEKELTCGFEESEKKSEGTEETPDPLAGEDEALQPICGQEEIELHTHTAACFGAGGAVVCGQLEVLEHQHTEDCFRVVQEASEEKVLDCAYTGSEEKKDEEDEEKPANSDSTDEEEEKPADSSAGEDKDGEKPADSDSTEEKPANSDSTGEKPADSGSTGGDKDGNEGTEKDADKDTDKDGKTPTDGTTVPSDPDDAPVLAPATLAERVLAAAESYIGYKEDTEDCDIDADGETRGLTRFGLHYGIPYEKWDAMFVAYCLEEAGVEELPSAADCLFDIDVWASMLDGAGYCQTAELYTPAPGDVAFFDLDGDGTLDHVAFVEKVTDTRLFVIAGDSNDCVRRASYARANESVVGYGVLPRDEDEPQDSPADEPDEGAADDDLTGEPSEDETEDDPAASDPVDEPQDGEDSKTDEKDPDKPDEDGKTDKDDPDKAGEDDKTEEEDKKDEDAAQDPDEEPPAEPQTAAEKLLAEAVRHIGYTESAEDCQEDADGESRGATLFGEHYGRPYEKWDALFVAYCLEKAGVEGLPAAADCNFDIDSWMTLWDEAGRFEPAGLSAPAPGDLAFFDLDADDQADHVAVVEKAAENRVSVIAGDTAGAAADVADSVRRTSYSMLNERLLGYARLGETIDEKDADGEESQEKQEELSSNKTYSYKSEDILVEVKLKGDTALPDGTTLAVRAITEEAENYSTLVRQAEEAVARQAMQVALYDISFYTPEGKYLSVGEDAAVSLQLKQPEAMAKASELVVLHYQDEEMLPIVLETIKQEAKVGAERVGATSEETLLTSADTADSEATTIEDEPLVLTFETEGFSVFAVMALGDEALFSPDDGEYAIVNMKTSDATTGVAMLAEGIGGNDTGNRAAKTVTVVQGSDGIRYAIGQDITVWSFERQDDGTYYISANVNGDEKYLSIGAHDSVVTLSDTAQKITLVTVNGSDELVRLDGSTSGRINLFGGEVSRGFGSYNDTSVNTQFALCRLSGLLYDINLPSMDNKGIGWDSKPTLSSPVQTIDENTKNLFGPPDGYYEEPGTAGIPNLYRFKIKETDDLKSEPAYTAGTLENQWYGEERFDGWMYTDENAGTTYLLEAGAEIKQVDNGTAVVTASKVVENGTSIKEIKPVEIRLPAGAVLTGKWSEVSNIVTFFVNYTGTILDTENDVTGRNQKDFTRSVAVGHIFYGTQKVGVDDTFANDANEEITAAFRPGFDKDDPSTQIVVEYLRECTVPSQTGENYQTEVRTEAFGANKYMVEENTLKLLKETGRLVRVASSDGENPSIDNSLCDTEHYEVRWYVLKEQTDTWHIDGVLIAKTSEIAITKTFSGLNAYQTEAVLGGTGGHPSDSSFKIDAKLGTTPQDYLTFQAESKEGQVEYEGHTPTSDLRNSYHWTFHAIDGEYYTFTEDNYEVDGYDVSCFIVHYHDGSQIDTINGDSTGNAPTTDDPKPVVKGGSTTGLSFNNFYTQTGTGAMAIVKRDQSIGSTDSAQGLLQGATFKLYTDEICTQEYQTSVSNANGTAYFNNLDTGTYYLKETQAPPGYTASSDVWKVVVRKSTANSIVVELYEPGADGKYDEKEVTLYNGGLTGSYIVYNASSESTVTITKSFSGLTTSELNDLVSKSSTNYLDAEYLPSGYYISLKGKTNGDNEVGTDEKTSAVLTLTEATRSQDMLTFTWKVDAMAVKTSEGEKIEYTVSEHNFMLEKYADVVITAAVNGNSNAVTIDRSEEVAATEEFSLQENSHDVIDLTNHYTNTFTLRLQKVDKETNAPLPGAKFTIYGPYEKATDVSKSITYKDPDTQAEKKGYFIGEIEADEQGIAKLEGLALSKVGQTFVYVIDESYAPEGYAKLTEPIVSVVSVNTEGYADGVYKEDVPNSRRTSFELPETGGRGWRTQTVCGAVLLALPLLYGIYLYHRRRKGGM